MPTASVALPPLNPQQWPMRQVEQRPYVTVWGLSRRLSSLMIVDAGHAGGQQDGQSFKCYLERHLRNCSGTAGSWRKVATAATCSLRLGHPARALKYAAHALFLQPQEEHRQLVRHCTKELEYQGRAEALQAALVGASHKMLPGAAGTVSRLLRQLQQQDTDCTAEALRTLAKELVRGGVDSQIAFDQLGGYNLVLPYWSASSHADIAQVLLAAGVCQLHTTLQLGAQGLDLEQLAHAGHPGAASMRANIRVRWPPVVLQQLMTTVLATRQAGEGEPAGQRTWTPVAQCALNLMNVAALDPHQRQMVLSSSCTSRDLASSRGSRASDPGSGGPAQAPFDTSISTADIEAEAEASDVVSWLVDQLLDDCESEAGEVQGITASASDDMLACSASTRVEGAAKHMEGPAKGCHRRTTTSVSCFELGSASNAASVHPDASLHPSVLAQLLAAVWDACWLRSLPAAPLTQLVQLISRFAMSSNFDRQRFQQAGGGKVVSLLLHMYNTMQGGDCSESSNKAADEDSIAGDGTAAWQDPCCRLLLSALHSLCLHEPALLRAEAFCSRQRQGSAAPAASARPVPSVPASSSLSRMVLVPTPLLGQLVQAARHELLQWQSAAAAAGPPNHTVKGAFVQGLRSPDSSAGVRPAGGSLIEGWVALLGVIVAGSKVAARELHRCRLLGFLQDVADASDGTPALQQAVQMAYGACARQCPEMSQALFDSRSVMALLSMAQHSGQPSLVLAALDRLTPLLAKCSTADYNLIVGQPGGGVLAAAHQLMLLSLAAKRARSASGGGDVHCSTAGTAGEGASTSSSTDINTRCHVAAKLVHPWEAAVAAAAKAAGPLAMGAVAGVGTAGLKPKCSISSSVPDFSMPQAGVLKDAAQCLVLACLDHARRQAGLKAMQAPRDGYWASVRPRDLLMLERRLREDWAAAMLPQASQHPAAAAFRDVAADVAQTPSLSGCRPVTAAVRVPKKVSGRASAKALNTWDGAPAINAEVSATPAQQARTVVPCTEMQLSPLAAPKAGGEAVAEQQAAYSSQCCSLAPSTEVDCPSPAAVSEPAMHEAPEPPAQLLRSCRSASLEDTAHKDSRHTSFRAPGSKAISADNLCGPAQPAEAWVLV